MSARWVLCICILGRELWKCFLSRLTSKQREKPLPAEVSDIYDADRWNLYLGICKEEHRVSLIRRFLSRAIDLVLIFSPFFSWVDGIAGDNYLLGLLICGVIINLVNLPVDYFSSLYDEFKIQKKYEQSNHTFASFNKDYFVGEVSRFVLSLLCLSVVCVAFKSAIDISVSANGGLTGAFRAACTFFPILLAVSFVVVLCGLAVEFALYKFRPMPAGEIRTCVESMLASCKKRVRWLTVYNESAKSNEKNAFLLNIPGFRMISIADNSLESDRPREVLAVIAHEVGHLKHRFAPYDLIKFLSPFSACVIIVALLSNVAALFLVDAWIRDSFCLGHTSAFLSLQFITLVIGPINLILDIPYNYARRQREYEADQNAVREGYGQDLAEMLKSAYKDELSNVNTHPFREFLEHDHPALPKRLRAIYEGMDRISSQA